MGIFSSIIGAFDNSAEKAAKQAKKTAEREKAAATAAFDPYVQSGYGAGQNLDTIFGIGGDLDARRAQLQANYEASPIFQNIFKPALEQSGNAFTRFMGNQGTLRSGATLKGLQNRAADLGNRAYGQFIAGNQDIRNSGQNALGNLYNLRAGQTNNIINSIYERGNARMAQNQALGSAIDGGVNLIASAFGYGNPFASFGGSGGASGAASSAAPNPFSSYSQWF